MCRGMLGWRGTVFFSSRLLLDLKSSIVAFASPPQRFFLEGRRGSANSMKQSHDVGVRGH